MSYFQLLYNGWQTEIIKFSRKTPGIPHFTSRKSGAIGQFGQEYAIAHWQSKRIMVCFGSGLAVTLTTTSSSNPDG